MACYNQANHARCTEIELPSTGQCRRKCVYSITDGDALKFKFGDASSHAGEFTFATGIKGKLDKTWAWPVAQVTQILKLIETNECEMSFSDDGALQITLDSGMASYQYILPAQSK